MSEHKHTEKRVENSRSWSVTCSTCGEWLGVEDKPPIYSVYVQGWEGSMRVWYAPNFDTPEEAEAWIARQGEWEEGRPRVEEVYNY
jgi:hypothetical protein